MYNKIFDEEKWKQVNQENKTIMEDFLLEYKARKMKDSTLKQYKNDCRIILCLYQIIVVIDPSQN